jgi:fibronectin type 3 domain-containing protein
VARPHKPGRLAGAIFIALACLPLASGRAHASTIVASITDARLDGARTVAVAGNTAFVAAQNADAVVAVDISQPAAPRIVGTVTAPALDGATGIVLTGNYAAVTSRVAGTLSILDVHDPSTPVLVGSVQDPRLAGAAKLVVRDGFAYVTALEASALTIVDISAPATPTVVGTVQDATVLDDVTGIDIVGQYAYVTGSQPGANRFTVVDIGDPTQPAIVASLDDVRFEGAGAVDVVDTRAFVAAADADALTIVDVSDPTSPKVLSSLTTGTGYDSPTADLRDVDVVGTTAYVVGRANAVFTAIDVSDPVHPTVASSLFDSTSLQGSRDLAITNGFALVAASDSDRLTVLSLAGAQTLAAPANLRVAALAPGSVTLQWDPSPGAASYTVFRDNPGKPPTAVATVSNTSTRLTDLRADTAYTWFVRASDAQGAMSPASARLSVTTPAVAAPANLRASGVTTSGVTLAWSAVESATKYYVYRGTGSTGALAYIGSATSTSFANRPLDSASTYRYAVRAVSAAGTSDYSTAITVTTLPIPLPPANLAAVPVSSTGINLSWSAADGATKYYVYRGTGTTGALAYIGSATTTSFSSRYLTAATSYRYAVRTVTPAGTSDYSATVTATTKS